MKIALGMIIRNLEAEEEILRFIDNAESYGHKLECVIIAYTQRMDPLCANSIRKRKPLYTIDIKNPEYCYNQFKLRGMSRNAVESLLECPVNPSQGLVPYGFKRSIVTTEAILRGMDVLFFVDNDVFPTVLTETPDGIGNCNADFFGAHLKHLKTGSLITTGEYSGYNILPPASFDGMEDLLAGLQKSDMLEYWQSSGEHNCLAVLPPEPAAEPCTKILGGNTAITLSSFDSLPPFFSSSYVVGDELFLCRGEDTVLGLGIANSGITCTDIGLYPFHDTYKDYPSEPDLQGDPKAQERFFYACTGWVGRNPFLNYLRGGDLESIREKQRGCLERGLRALAEYTKNPRYYGVLRNFDTSWDSVGRYIEEYERVLEAWEEFISKRGEIE